MYLVQFLLPHKGSFFKNFYLKITCISRNGSICLTNWKLWRLLFSRQNHFRPRSPFLLNWEDEEETIYLHYAWLPWAKYLHEWARRVTSNRSSSESEMDRNFAQQSCLTLNVFPYIRIRYKLEKNEPVAGTRNSERKKNKDGQKKEERFKKNRNSFNILSLSSIMYFLLTTEISSCQSRKYFF